MVTISAAVEGIVDEAVARRLIEHVGAHPGPIYVKEGKPRLKERLAGYNQAARLGPWLVLVDLDRDADCAPAFRAQWLPHPSPDLCFRVAVREVEAWLLADAEALARFLAVARSRLPPQPESLPDPKAAMVDLARTSRRRQIREDMVPRPESGRPVGPAYASRLIEFVSDSWRVDEAAKRAQSLQRALKCLQDLVRSSAGSQIPQGPYPS